MDLIEGVVRFEERSFENRDGETVEFRQMIVGDTDIPSRAVKFEEGSTVTLKPVASGRYVNYVVVEVS